MKTADKLIQTYFNVIYNPVYDLTTARLNRYRSLQRWCVTKLDLTDGDRVLCVGVGTGNEIVHILDINRNVEVVGVDCSNSALQKARRKASILGKEVDVQLMDARNLKFGADSFDKVLCIHVMDFLGERGTATKELFRVLKSGGRFVVTYPSGKEDTNMFFGLIRDNFRQKNESGKNVARIFFEVVGQLMTAIVYLPLLLRPSDGICSYSEIENLIQGLHCKYHRIENDAIYHDFVVYGVK